MFRVINKYFFCLFVFITIFLLQNCLSMSSTVGPGYAVEIEVNEDVIVRVQDIKQLEKLAVEQKFTKQKEVNFSEQEKGIYYGRALEEKKYKELRYKFINLIYSFDIENDGEDSMDHFRNLRILIYNDWEGQKPLLKQEIDMIAAVIYAELENLVGEVNLKMEQRKTSPPF